MTIITGSAAETEAAGFDLAARVRPGTVLAFIGDLGAGKTTFTRGLARGLGITVPVTSPTYTIVNEYGPLIHFDMYRLTAPDELFEIGWEDYLQQNAVIAVEWSENVREALPPDTVYINMEKLGEQGRKITIVGDALARPVSCSAGAASGASTEGDNPCES